MTRGKLLKQIKELQTQVKNLSRDNRFLSKVEGSIIYCSPNETLLITQPVISEISQMGIELEKAQASTMIEVVPFTMEVDTTRGASMTTEYKNKVRIYLK